MAEQSTWPVEFDWRKTALKLSKIAIKFAVTGVPPSPDTVIDAAVDNIKLAPGATGKDGAPPTPEALITLWLNQAMALAMIDVFREAQEHASKPLPLEIEESAVQPGGLDPTALYEPQDVDVWAMVGEATLMRLDDSGVAAATALEIAGDLSDRFVERFWGLVAGHEARGGTIPNLLKRDILRQRAAEAAAWRENRRRLIRTPREADKNPLLDGKASLEQIYVPLQAYEAVENSRLIGLRRRGEDDDGDSRTLMRLVDLDEELDRWVESPKAASVRIVAGGPGFGKSSAALMLAARRAIDPEWRVLLVPLHQVDDAMTWDSVEDAIRATSTVTPGALAHAARGRKILLIFDGLDELATKNESGVLPLDTLVSQIRAVVDIRNRDGRGMRALLLGRDLAAGEAGRAARAVDDMLHVLPLRPTDEDRERYRWQDEKAPEFDHRQDWWRRYRGAVPAAPDLPQTLFENESFTEITSLPVLMSLLAFWLGEKPAPDNLATLGRVELYDGICKAAYHRAWRGNDQPPHWGVENEDDFFRLVEDIALATWRRNSRRATVADLTAVLKAGAGPAGEEQAALIAESDGAAAKRLLMLFFFRDGVQEQDRSASTSRMVFEFTHKSFADYLLARRLLRTAREKCELGEWVRLFGWFRIEMVVVDFLRLEAIRQRVSGQLDSNLARNHLSVLVAEAVDDGFPLIEFEKFEATSSAIFRHASDAELALLAALDAVCRSLDRAEEKIFADIGWSSIWGAWKLMNRQLSRSTEVDGRVYFDMVYKNIISRLKCSIHDKFDDDIESVDYGSSGCILSGVNLHEADLRHSRLAGVNLALADLRYSDLSNADLRHAGLSGATLHSSKLLYADLEGADLSEADLSGADLTGVNLFGANLERTDLRRVVGMDEAKNLDLALFVEKSIMSTQTRLDLGLSAQAQDIDYADDGDIVELD